MLPVHAVSSILISLDDRHVSFDSLGPDEVLLRVYSLIDMYLHV